MISFFCYFCSPAQKNKHAEGLGALEVIVGVAIITFALLGIVASYNRFIASTTRNTREIQAAYLLAEGIEAMRSLRDEGWTSSIAVLSPGVSYHLALSGLVWTSTLTPAVFIDGVFDRTVIVENVLRDVNDDIAVLGTADPNTRKITVTVAWFLGKATSTRQVATYLTNIFGT